MNAPPIPEGYELTSNGMGDLFWIEPHGKRQGHWVTLRGKSKARFVIRKKPDDWTIMAQGSAFYVTNGNHRFYCESQDSAEWLFGRVRGGSTSPHYVSPSEAAFKERVTRANKRRPID